MFEKVTEFENTIADFFGAPYAVSTDCCTHAIELCFIHKNISKTLIPKQTYLSIPMMCEKLKIDWDWIDLEWEEYYNFDGTNIYDAATLWRENSYIKDTFMCISFQYKKHLSLGRGGVILCDKKADYETLLKMGYDGRVRGTTWKDQEISSCGYHYYMTPETAMLGLNKFKEVKNKKYVPWSNADYPDISKNSCWIKK